MSDAQEMLNSLMNIDSELANMGIAKPENWPLMNQIEKTQYLENVKNQLNKTDSILNTVEKQNELEMNTIDELNKNTNLASKKSKCAFNLHKYSQENINEQSGNIGVDNFDQPNTAKVREILDSFVSKEMSSGLDEKEAKAKAVDEAYKNITSQFVGKNEISTDPNNGLNGDSAQLVRDAVNSYYSSSDEAEKDQAASLLARTIFPQSEDGIEVVNDKDVHVNVANVVNESNLAIQKLAKFDANNSKPFNLSKVAHIKNVYVYDPNKATNDEFTHQPMSDNDLLERNKGWGIRLNDYYSLNWEKVWRETVMDKYDPLYIERRFEVDKNIPSTNNYQLEPGQKRKFTPPEYGNTESRLEANRTKMNSERGYEPSDDGKVFNWKKAQAESQKKNAQQIQLNNVPSSSEMNGDVKSPINWKCSICGDIAKNGIKPIKCEKCGAMNSHQAVMAPTAPSPAKINTIASTYGGVFWDSNNKKFIVIADNNKKEFDSYDDAEKEFKNSPVVPAVKPMKRKILNKNILEKQKEIAQHADNLGIDG